MDFKISENPFFLILHLFPSLNFFFRFTLFFSICYPGSPPRPHQLSQFTRLPRVLKKIPISTRHQMKKKPGYGNGEVVKKKLCSAVISSSNFLIRGKLQLLPFYLSIDYLDLNAKKPRLLNDFLALHIAQQMSSYFLSFSLPWTCTEIAV